MRIVAIATLCLTIAFAASKPIPRSNDLSTSFVVAPSIAAPYDVRKTRSSVFSLMVGEDAICTAFVVKHRLISAGHCVEELDAEEVGTIAAYNYETGARYPVRLVKHLQDWPKHDFAIFEFIGTPPNVGLTTTKNMPKVGDAVWAFIGPHALSPLLANGVYAGRVQVVDDEENEVNGMYATTVAVEHGASGSPVMNNKGQVWGILVAMYDNIQTMALVVPVEEIK